MSSFLNAGLNDALARRDRRRKVMAEGGCLHPVVVQKPERGGSVCQECDADVEVEE